MTKQVNDIMTADPICCLTTDSVQRAARLMRDAGIGSIPVVRDPGRELVGIVTDRDLALNVIAEARDPNSTAVGDVMTREPVTCLPEDRAQKVLDLMAKHQLRRIPVVDAHNHIIGIVAQADVAVRMDEPNKTGEVVESISEPNKVSQTR
jgi:CBS domain-containing protein